jgi:membrane-associated protein
VVELLTQLLDFIRHLDVHLENIMREYELATYFILALIIFCETGLVVTPFLPGDSLLFAAGAITAKTGILNVWLLIPLLFLAAILGDNVNYFFGRFLGNKVFVKDYWFLKRKYIDKTQSFYDEYGGRTLVIARFVPIVRTFAPFVAGVGRRIVGHFVDLGRLFLRVTALCEKQFRIGDFWRDRHILAPDRSRSGSRKNEKIRGCSQAP